MTSTKEDAEFTEALSWIAAGGPLAEKGVRRIFDCSAEPLRRYFLRHRVPDSMAEELVQDTFIDIVRGAASWRGEAPARVWFWSVARNRLLSFHRRERPEINLDDDAWAALADSSVMASTSHPPDWQRDCLRRQMDAFAGEHPERAACLQFIVTQDWSVPELATFLNRSAAAAKEYLSQCRKKLRQYLSTCEEWIGEYH